MKWALLRFLLGTVGRLSRGIRIGYAYGFDSGTMLDYVYVNKTHGAVGIGKLIDRAFLNAIGWRAIRARRELLTEIIHAEIERREDPVRILDVAAGPGRYLHDVAAAHPQRVSVLCRDKAEAGLRQGEQLAAARGITNVHYEWGDALHPEPAETLGAAPDIIVVSGLYELLLDTEAIADSMARLRGILAPGGVLVFTTQERHPQLDFIANVLPNRDGVLWVMECRSAEEMEKRAGDAGYGPTSTRREPVGLFAVTTAQRDAPDSTVRDTHTPGASQ